jgi:hypothetical protein
MRADLEVTPSFDSLLSDPSLAANLEPADIAAVLTQLAGLQSALAARLLENGRHQEPAVAPDKMLTLEQAAALIHQTPEWIRRHAKRLPFVKRISRKKFLVSEQALNRWLANRKP